MAGQVRLALQGPIARVTLSHPGKLDAMSRAMWRELREAFVAIQNDAQVRCAIVAGENGGFCAGGDIAEYPQFRFHPDTLRRFHEEEVWGGLAAMLACEVPVVAQIDGEQLISTLKSQLANFKIPKRCFVVQELPRNTMGKVQKNLLREAHKALFA